MVAADTGTHGWADTFAGTQRAHAASISPDPLNPIIILYSAQVRSATYYNLGTCLTPEVPAAALLSNDELVSAPWP